MNMTVVKSCTNFHCNPHFGVSDFVISNGFSLLYMYTKIRWITEYFSQNDREGPTAKLKMTGLLSR